MSYRAIAAALALSDVSAGERLTAFSLASFANRDERAWPGARLAATRAGLSRSQYLDARRRLVQRGFITVDDEGGGRGNAALITLDFAQHGPRVDGEINAELFELVLSYGRTRGSERLLLTTLAALADSSGIVEDVTTDELRGFAGLADRSYRRARAQLLEEGDVELDEVGGGRAKTNRWQIRDPRLIKQRPLSAPRRRAAPSLDRPLVAEVSRRSKTDHSHPASEAAASVAGRPPGAGSTQNPSQFRTVLRGNRGQNRTVSAKTPVKFGPFPAETPAQTPAETPAPIARGGREPRNLGTPPPSPPEGGRSRGELTIEEPYVSSRGRKRRRSVRVDLDEVRRRLGLPAANDRDDWRQIRSLLSDTVDEALFAIWFEPLELVAVDDSGALVIAGDPGVCPWLRSRFGPLLLECAQRVGRALRVAEEPERRALAVSAVEINRQEVS